MSLSTHVHKKWQKFSNKASFETLMCLASQDTGQISRQALWASQTGNKVNPVNLRFFWWAVSDKNWIVSISVFCHFSGCNFILVVYLFQIIDFFYCMFLQCADSLKQSEVINYLIFGTMDKKLAWPFVCISLLMRLKAKSIYISA